MKPRAEKLRLLAVRAALAPIGVYQRLISPLIGRRCKYEPTCSRYAAEALRSHGVVKGTVLAGWRLARCNPFSNGGYDPLERQRIFKGHRQVAPPQNPSSLRTGGEA
jgi:putative membrane protein insertion efficiency factor